MIDVAGSLPKHALELFECPSIGGKPRLTRTSCGQRHKAARRTARPTRGPLVTPWLATCAGCEIGAAHARGERPDVTAAQLVRREPEVVEMPQAKGKTYAHEGEELTLEEWSRSPKNASGLSAQAIRSRLEGEWIFSDALTMPKGSARPSTSPPKKSTKPTGETPRKKPLVPQRPRAAPEQVARAVEAVERKAAEKTLAEEVREVVAALQPDELLRAAGWDAQAVGVGPAGRIVIVVRGVAA